VKRFVIWISIIIVFVVLALLGRKMPAPHSVPPPSAGEAFQWRECQVAGVILEAPGDFRQMKVDFGSTTEAIEKADGHEFASRALEIQVIRILYKEGIALSLESSVQGSVDGFARNADVRNLTHKETDCTVSGKPAMRVSIAGDRARGAIRLEGETILDGQKLYQVQVLYEARYLGGPQDARKILDSIRITPLSPGKGRGSKSFFKKALPTNRLFG
jgi:hypothetical protein